ncbi:MAG: HEPN domain-containing protein [Candidatus Woesearchaeota archaeon]|nr:HEPN domain-containing protein [Candidatus Woesearchaeota archaeon]
MNEQTNPAKVWFEKATEDFDTALFNFQHKKYDYAAFLFQQAAEKALKAVLIAKGKGVIRTHDCFSLARIAGAPEKIVRASEIATPFYARTRYPDAMLVIVEQEDVERLKNACNEVLAWSKKNC